ncbi:MAG TPA: glycoside hydrolase family 97 protein, partial [Terriglobia bacterium]|nr:glycoside hydrolase family 97 protein [Terriglobia bacterium]
TIQQPWQTVVGKSKVVADHCNELHLWLEEARPTRRQLEVLFRAYNDGVAFRYFLPEQQGVRDFRLTSERSEFHFAANHVAWAAQYGTYASSQEREFDRITLSQISPSSIIGLPMLIQAGEGAWVAITEAALEDWAGMYLAGAGTCPNAVVTSLSPRPDEPGVLVNSRAPRYSPWRVLMIGQRPGDLIESNLVLNLSEPCALADTSWIKPGKSAWDRWWSGDYAPDANFKIGMNTATMNYFTQFAADMGWEYVLVDWTWYGDPLNPNADITKSIPEVDLPAIIKYAHDRNVKVLIWLRWNHVNRQMDQAFPLYEKWGISGVKIDFMDRDDQEMVNFYYRVVRKAAEHHLLVDFHGAYKPTGLRRTYPNLITREGVMGNEYNKWSTRITPEHKLTLPFTRMLAGPMDFTPGGFRNATKAAFRAQDTAPFVMGTRAQELGMLVVYESPLQVLCDSPYNYRGQPGLEFYRLVPTTWDETKVLDGQVGEFIVMARKSGNRWFIGAMNDSKPRTVEVSLSSLGTGKYSLQYFADAQDAADFPDHVSIATREIATSEKLAIQMAPGGGYAGVLTPLP